MFFIVKKMTPNSFLSHIFKEGYLLMKILNLVSPLGVPVLAVSLETFD